MTAPQRTGLLSKERQKEALAGYAFILPVYVGLSRSS
jgi:hypothetical protein